MTLASSSVSTPRLEMRKVYPEVIFTTAPGPCFFLFLWPAPSLTVVRSGQVLQGVVQGSKVIARCFQPVAIEIVAGPFNQQFGVA